MENPAVAGGSPEASGSMTRKEKRKMMKKLKRKQVRREMAIREKEEEEARLNDPEEQLRLMRLEEEERERAEEERNLFEEREREWIEANKRREEEEEAERQKKLLEESNGDTKDREDNLEKLEEDDGEWEYVESGPAEIIWKGNEIIVKKKTIKVPKSNAQKEPKKEEADRPTSNPLPPQSEAFSSHMSVAAASAQEVLHIMAQETPNFGTEQDKAHCPFHLKTGVCRFGQRCNRAHFYPEKACTLLIKNMYAGPGLAWEQDEGLEYTDEEVDHAYEEFYEDVHTEFLKYGELVNFKVCRNSSYHLRGNVYVHYKSVHSAVLAYGSINGRYFAGKQITCEFVSVTKWKVAICGEYMKSRLKTCSRGSACNFMHCFRNPGGDYEWADWDKPPPKYWINKMVSLFGFSDQSYYDSKAVESGDVEEPRSSHWRRTPTSDRYDLRHRKQSHDHHSVRDDSDLERENQRRRRDSSRSEKHQTRDFNRHYSTREGSYYERLGSSSGKQKEVSNRRYHKKESIENKEDSKESYGEEEIDGSIEKSKRLRDKYYWDKHSDDYSGTKSRRKNSISKRESMESSEHKTESKRRRQYEEEEVSEESYGEEESDGRRERSRRQRDKYHWDKHSDNSANSKSRRKHSTSKRDATESIENKTDSKRRCRYEEAKEVSEESYGEEESDGRRDKSKLQRDKYHWDNNSDDSANTKSRRKHSTSKREATAIIENRTDSKRRRRYEEVKEVSKESYGEEKSDGRRDKSKLQRDKYHWDNHSDDSANTKSRRKHSTSKREATAIIENRTGLERRRRYEEVKEVSEESYGEEESDGRRDKSKLRQDKCYWEKHSDGSSDSMARKHRTSTKKKSYKKKHRDRGIEEEYYGNPDSISNKLC